MSEQKKAERNQLRPVLYLFIAGLAALAGFVAVYASLAPKGNGPQPVAVKSKPKEPAGSAADAPASGAFKELNRGKMTAFVFRLGPKPLPEFSFQDGDGKERTVADWKGKVVLLNLWATWCAPCLKEMPALDALKTKLGGEDFDVVALSIDRGGLEKPRNFLNKIKVKSLDLYNDPTSKMASKLRAVGMPTTLLLDRDGHELGRLTGPAEWDSDDAVTLIKAAMALGRQDNAAGAPAQ